MTASSLLSRLNKIMNGLENITKIKFSEANLLSTVGTEGAELEICEDREK